MPAKRKTRDSCGEDEIVDTVLTSIKKGSNIKDSIYYFFTEVTDASAEALVKWILEQNLEKKFKKLIIIINSYGGDVTAAMCIIDAILGSSIPISAIGLGAVGSSGLLIFLCCKHRTLTPNTSILSHQFSSVSFGKQHELLGYVEEIDNTHERIMSIYRKFTKLTDKKIKELLLRETDARLTALQAKKLGLCDSVKDLLI